MLAEYAFAATFLVLVVLERVLNAIALLVVRLVWGTDPEDQGLKGYAGTQLVGAGFTFATSMVSALGYAASGLFGALLSYAQWLLLGFAVFSLLFVVQEQYASLLIQVVDTWNDTYGAIVYEAIFFPLQVMSARQFC